MGIPKQSACVMGPSRQFLWGLGFLVSGLPPYQRGSPAHAGIDQVAAVAVLWSTGFPRTRGDRPCPLAPGDSTTGVPPHTRG